MEIINKYKKKWISTKYHLNLSTWSYFKNYETYSKNLSVKRLLLVGIYHGTGIWGGLRDDFDGLGRLDLTDDDNVH